MPHDPFRALTTLPLAGGGSTRYFSLAALESAGIGRISRLPVSIRIVLESVLRHCDGRIVTEEQVRELAAWQPGAARQAEIPFVVARILLQDFTGVPLLCDLAAMRGVARWFGHAPGIIEPLVAVDLVVDHSVQVDYWTQADALDLNMRLEFRRNAERYRFIKWGMQAFDRLRVVPPGVGIVHQVNLESLARGVLEKDGVTYPDSLVGTDSHTTMINGLGIVGWGVGGIEAEAGMLGQPVYLLTPDVVGVELRGRLPDGTTATDLVLSITERLRRARVVDKFVEFFGDGAASLTVPDRATIANMAPEYGATMGYFPVDDQTVKYLAATGRSDAEVDAFERYFRAQNLFGMPLAADIDYSELIVFELDAVRPSVAGPKRPQDRIDLTELGERFDALLTSRVGEGGYGVAEASRRIRRPTAHAAADVGHGDVLIAAITSCTNTSNPGVMLAAGLLARKAVQRGLTVGPRVKTSLAPGSRVVTDYLARAGLLGDLESLGFRVVAYGCTTCIGNAGPLDPALQAVVTGGSLVCAAVLSGNRNFEARIHPAIKANFLMSPPLVVAFAIAGRVDIDLDAQPLGIDRDGTPVMLKDLWPTPAEISAALAGATDAGAYRDRYRDVGRSQPLWNAIPSEGGPFCAWPDSTYIAEPPFFDGFGIEPAATADILGARALAIFGDSVTTDHISPAGSIAAGSPAGVWLAGRGVAEADFNSYGSRRGHHEVMVRGTFANPRIRNRMLAPGADGSPVEGGLTRHQPTGEAMTIHAAAMRYLADDTPTLVFAGEEYGTGSSRDWAAKGTRLLGVRAVVAASFERIHRANLVGMGVLPLQFAPHDRIGSLGLTGNERFDILGVAGDITPRQQVLLVIHRPGGGRTEVALTLRADTPVEILYLHHGGILPYVLRGLMSGATSAAGG
jgi:aconitate hydratase